MTPEAPEDTELLVAEVRPAEAAAAGRPTWLAPVLVLLLVLAAAGAVWTGVQVRDVRAEHRADSAALAAGRTAATDFTSYDYRHLDDDLGRVTAMSTGTFREQFSKALGALTQAIQQAKGVSVGRITHAGLTRRTGDTAVVVAAVDATITNSSTTEPSIRRYRLQITLDHSTGSWLISDVTPVG
jgi:Mce-associated membrane protein